MNQIPKVFQLEQNMQMIQMKRARKIKEENTLNQSNNKTCARNILRINDNIQRQRERHTYTHTCSQQVTTVATVGRMRVLYRATREEKKNWGKKSERYLVVVVEVHVLRGVAYYPCTMNLC